MFVPPNRPPVANVEGNRDPFGSMALDRRADERRVTQGGRSDHDAIDTGLEDGRDVLAGPQAARDLEPRAVARERRDDRGNRRRLPPLPRPGPVEVDDMDPFRSRRGECSGNRQRIFPVHLLAGEVSLTEPDDLAVPEVDRRQNHER